MNKYIPAIAIGFGVFIASTFLMNLVYQNLAESMGWSVFIGAFAGYISANLAGNRKVPMASGDEKQAALQMQPPPGKAVIYVYREGFVAKLAGLNVQLDGKEFAQLTAPKFTCVVISPGTHTLTCGFGGLAGPQSKQGAYEFTAPADSVAAIGIGVKMGMLQGAMSFTPITDAAAARAKIAAMPMVAANPAEI
jgi:hypothetical protein